MTAKKQSKTAFVLSLPHNMPAKEVVAKAKAAGLTITAGYAYEIRSAANRKGKKGKLAGATRRANGGGSSESTFRSLVVDLGLARARSLLSEVERRLGDVVAGR